MTYLSDALFRWEKGPYAMKALVGCAVQGSKGWWVQLRTPAVKLFDQVILASAKGATREEAIERARIACGADEVIEWRYRSQMTHTGAWHPKGGGVLGAMERCEEAIEALLAVITPSIDDQYEMDI